MKRTARRKLSGLFVCSPVLSGERCKVSGLKAVGVEVFVDQHAVDGLEVEFHFPFCFEFEDEEVGCAFECLLFPDVYKGGVKRLNTVGVQTVVGEVFHCFEV